MNIIWKGSPNFGYPTGFAGRGTESVRAIIQHIAQGTKAGLDATFLKPGSVSAHYGVMKDGTIHQYVLEENAAYGAGVLNLPDESMPWLPPAGTGRGMRVNQRTINIEHEGFYWEVLTDAQYQASAELTKDICDRWSIPKNNLFIVGHNRTDSLTRVNDPGPNFPWANLFAYLNKSTMSEAQIAELNAVVDILSSYPNMFSRIAAAVEQQGYGFEDPLHLRLAEEISSLSQRLREIPYR